MKKLPFFIHILLFLCALNLKAQDFEYSTTCQNAYRSIFQLKINEGNQLLLKEKITNKDNLMPFFLENYSDFLMLYISDDVQMYKKLSPKKDERLHILYQGNQKSPYYLYTQANIYLQWAFIKIKFGDYISAVWDVRKAYQLLKSNQEKFPKFAPNYKDLALLNTIFGAIPDKYRFGAKILGLKGDIDQGLKDLSTLLRDPNMPFREEASIMYTMLLLHLGKDKKGAWDMLDELHLDLEGNLLNHFITASVAHYTGKNDKVIQILSTRPRTQEFFPFPYLDYMLGNAKLNRLDKDADLYLKSFLAKYKGTNYLREANRKLAWHNYVHQRPDLYDTYMSKIPYLGSNSLDEDKAATREALSRKRPHLQLLKARILSDGAYYAKALQELEAIEANSLSKEDKIEYHYRSARIYDDMGQMPKALPFYEWTIKNSGDSKTYFAPNACIKLGNYYESKKDKVTAAHYYRKAITFTEHEYKNSIDAQAKAGLNRIQ